MPASAAQKDEVREDEEGGGLIVQRRGPRARNDEERAKLRGQDSAKCSRCILTRQSLHEMPNIIVVPQCELQLRQLR
jgi:hypothetical protein